jgi:ABC-type polysaccharide/polyol phosphate transport system ATPase subunit
VTHDMNWVVEYCNRAILLERGHVVLEGPPQEVVDTHLARMTAAKEEREASARAAGLDPRIAR